MEKGLNILLVDDEPDFVNGLARLIEVEYDNLDISKAGSGDEALAILGSRPFNLIISDLRMPGRDGLSLTRAIVEKYPSIKVIILTGFGTIEKAVEAVKLGSFDFLTKPLSSDQLYSTLNKAINYIELEQENNRLKELLDSKNRMLLGESPAMLQVHQSIEAVAGSDYPVLIHGESGTGKELAAKMVHRLSKRSKRPFIAVNCPAIPDSLLESELFGYAKGAFTGADNDKDGLIIAAERGTLHLDEIGEISTAMQQKLLRFLQEGEVRPVGSTRNLQADVRIIASTNQPLADNVEDKTFRADLYYRLNVVSIRMPSLRERVEDIPLLAQFFLGQTIREMNIDDIIMEPDVLSYLTTKEWPGNVRELQNFIRRLVLFSSGKNISTATLKLVDSPNAAMHEIEGSLGPYKSMKIAVADNFTRNYFSQLLKETAGNVSEAARISGLSRVAIQKLCKRLNISPDSYRTK